MSGRRLYVGQPGISSAAVYTATANTRVTITAATVTNPTAGAVTFSAWLVPSGDTAIDSRILYDALSVDAGATVGLQFLVAHTLESGEAIHLAASAATSLTVRITGEVHS